MKFSNDSYLETYCMNRIELTITLTPENFWQMARAGSGGEKGVDNT